MTKGYVFFGTPEFAAIILEKLIEAEMPPLALVCNPDRPQGRNKEITPPATKQFLQYKDLPIEIFQPESKEELVKLKNKIFKHADLGIVAAYSQIIPQSVIDKPKLGIIGVHPSLLPKFRGASPIQSFILSGEGITGTTIYSIDDKVDHGPIIAQKQVTYTNEHYDTLMKVLAETGAKLLIDTLPQFKGDPFFLHPQDESKATYTKKFSPEDGYIPSNELESAAAGNTAKATEILLKIRALNPEPSVYTFINNKRTKLLDAELVDGSLILKRIQKEGKTPVDL
jgi:methionyl-tRNA formyltransferase